jgi:hypothetical protein
MPQGLDLATEQNQDLLERKAMTQFKNDHLLDLGKRKATTQFNGGSPPTPGKERTLNLKTTTILKATLDMIVMTQ